LRNTIPISVRTLLRLFRWRKMEYLSLAVISVADLESDGGDVGLA
jgi:hypothetical protein